tara:strand:- start:1992 stop:2375 length:384 start_codon:yes stop_codon:yes gene_type:complete
MLKNSDPWFDTFGEIYFSTIYPGVVKGWHIHHRMTLNYCVIVGSIKLVLYDDRSESPTRGEVNEIYIGTENYNLVKIPPLIWNGFKGIGSNTAILANCSSEPHDPTEIDRLDPFDNQIPYSWDIKHG